MTETDSPEPADPIPYVAIPPAHEVVITATAEVVHADVSVYDDAEQVQDWAVEGN